MNVMLQGLTKAEDGESMPLLPKSSSESAYEQLAGNRQTESRIKVSNSGPVHQKSDNTATTDSMSMLTNHLITLSFCLCIMHIFELLLTL